MNGMKPPTRSQIVLALAEIASKGRFEVTPQGASQMNRVFEDVAKLINELEEEEKAVVEPTE